MILSQTFLLYFSLVVFSLIRITFLYNLSATIQILDIIFNVISTDFPANIYLLKSNSRNARKRFKILSKLAIKS